MSSCSTTRDEKEKDWVDVSELGEFLPPLPDDVRLEVHSLKKPDGLLVSVHPPREPRRERGLERCTVDIVLVIDISSSMARAAPPPGAKSGSDTEDEGLSVLDLVRHAAHAIIETLSEKDRLSIVTYNHDATVVQTFTPMSSPAKESLYTKLREIEPRGATNMWAGLRKGFRQFKEAPKKEGRKGADAVPALFLLTDGMPNFMCPVEGYVPALRPLLKEAEAALPIMPTVHTIGFGYEIRSGLLQGIAEAAGGNYAFIPDSGMIGTVFVNAIANLYTTFATSATLTLAASGSSTLELKPLEGAALYQDHGDDLAIDLSSLQFGQSRDVYIRYGQQGPRSDSIVFVKLEYTKPGSARQQVVTTRPISRASKSLDPSVASYHFYRAKLCQFLASHFIQQENMSYEPGTWNSQSKQEKIASLASELKSCGYKDDLHKSLFEDLSGKEPRGQIRIAVSEESYFRKWGMHYLPSLLHAHRNQMRNTFKDLGPLQYGKDSPLFVKYNKALNELFNELDVWPGSLESTHMARPHGSHYDAQYVHPFLRHGISMARYNSADNPCFAGHCAIALACGASMPVSALRPGATVRTPVGARRVAAVVKTNSRSAVLCRLGKLWITPWHPVLDERRGAWVFPAEVAGCSVVRAASVYSVMLEPATEAQAHAVCVSGRWCVTLGHGVLVEKKERGEDARAHAFFGNYQACVRGLKRLPSGKGGVLRCGGVRRDGRTGLVCGFASPGGKRGEAGAKRAKKSARDVIFA